MRLKKAALFLLLLAGAAALLCGCAGKETEAQRYQKLLSAFEAGGYPAVLDDPPGDEAVAIYNASVWKRLTTETETVLVYFDESNRADYLVTMIDQQQYGYATSMGQRFVLVYAGENEGFKVFLASLE